MLCLWDQRNGPSKSYYWSLKCLKLQFFKIIPYITWISVNQLKSDNKSLAQEGFGNTRTNWILKPVKNNKPIKSMKATFSFQRWFFCLFFVCFFLSIDLTVVSVWQKLYANKIKNIRSLLLKLKIRCPLYYGRNPRTLSNYFLINDKHKNKMNTNKTSADGEMI